MKFNTQDTSFELRIAGYEFPHIANEPYDSNWLVIDLKVKSPQGSWSVSDPSLLTYEVSKLADWLENIAAHNFEEVECCFMEPVLEFRTNINNQVSNLEIRLFHEALPNWITDRRERQKGISLFFTLTDLDLNSAVAELRRQLQRYPQRTNK